MSLTSFAGVFVGVFTNVKERVAAKLIIPVVFPSMFCNFSVIFPNAIYFKYILSSNAVLISRAINAVKIEVGEGFAICPLREVRLLALIETDEHNIIAQTFNIQLWKLAIFSFQGAPYSHHSRTSSASGTYFSQLFLNLRWTFFS